MYFSRNNNISTAYIIYFPRLESVIVNFLSSEYCQEPEGSFKNQINLYNPSMISGLSSERDTHAVQI